MAELKIDTNQLVSGAIATLFAQSDPKALAEAMAITVLQKGTYRDRTVLEELVENAVKNVARGLIEKIMDEHTTDVERLLRERLEPRLVEAAVDQIVKKAVSGL